MSSCTNKFKTGGGRIKTEPCEGNIEIFVKQENNAKFSHNQQGKNWGRKNFFFEDRLETPQHFKALQIIIPVTLCPNNTVQTEKSFF
jgi:hypothetical protein